MKEYQFFKCIEEFEFDVPDNIYFFLHPEYVKRNGTENIVLFIAKQNNDVNAFIYFNIIERRAVSQIKSPFGGVGLFSEVDEDLISDFLLFIINQLKNLGLTQILINQYPDNYQEFNLENILIKRGFKKIQTDINQHINLGAPTFYSMLNSDKKYCLNKCNKENFDSRHLSYNEIPKAFEIVNDNLSRKNFPLTLSLKQIQKAFIDYPNNYYAFGTYDGEELIAAIMSVSINNNILYNFYHGYKKEYSKYSPLVSALNFEYNYLLKKDYRTIDLGISSVNGILNPGLFQFKKAIGSTISHKNSFCFFYD